MRLLHLFLFVVIVVGLLATFGGKNIEHFASRTATITSTGCENEALLDMACPTNLKVDSASLTYGRWDNKVCPHKSVTRNTKSKSKTYNISNTYKGKTTIDVQGKKAGHIAKENPYKGVFKQWFITAECN